MLKPILLGLVVLDILYTLDSMLIKITPINIMVLIILFIAYSYLTISFAKEANNNGINKRAVYGINEEKKGRERNYWKTKKDWVRSRDVESKRD